MTQGAVMTSCNDDELVVTELREIGVAIRCGNVATVQALVADWNFSPDAVADRISLLTEQLKEAEWRPIDDDTPHACHVLAARFDESFGEWIYGVVMSPPTKPFTLWRPLPDPPSRRTSINGT